MPEGKTLTIMKGEYPQVEGLGDNAKVRYSGEATVSWNGDQGTITFDSMDFETENKADRAMKEMKGSQEPMYSNSEEEDEI